MNPTSEQPLYRDGNDLITKTHATLSGQTFDLADISTVSIVPPILRPEYGYGLAAIGLAIAILGYIVWGTFLTPVMAGVVLVVVGIAIATIVRTSYTVNLNRTNGQTTTLLIPSRRKAEQIVSTLSGTISQRH